MDPKSTHNHKNPRASGVGLKPAPEDEYLAYSTYLSRQQILRRRSHHLKQLTKCYRGQYWGLMEELRAKHREYVWKFGRNPFQEEHKEDDKDNAKEEQVEDEIGDGIGNGIVEAGDGNGRTNGLMCASTGCKMKAMTLTTFCRIHILSDPKQQLYKPCEYVTESAQSGDGDGDGDGDVLCGKPALRSMVPSLCSGHFHIAQEQVLRALRKAGLNITKTNKIAPKLHVVIAEYVREIQKRRRRMIALRASSKKVVVPKVEIEN